MNFSQRTSQSLEFTLINITTGKNSRDQTSRKGRSFSLITEAGDYLDRKQPHEGLFHYLLPF